MDPHNSHVDNDFAKEHLGKLFLDHKKKDIDVSMIESKKVDRLFDNRKAVEKEICPREACLEERELVQKIASAADFPELMDCLSHKISTRTIDLMWEALKVDIENENVWGFIRWLLVRFNFDLNEVLGAMGSFLKAPYIDNWDMWSLRLWIVEMLETEAKIEEFNLTKEYLTIFPENHHIWANLKKLTVMLGDSVMLDELKFACDIIKLDPRHTYAWSLRCSMVMNIQNDGENRRELEFDFLNHLLSADPWNECAWLYRGDLISMRCSDITRKLKSQNTNGLTVDCISDILNKELIFIETALLKFLDNNLAWSHRMWVIDVYLHSIEHELEFTNRILMKDQKNRFAWSWRRWVFETFFRAKPTTGEFVFTINFLNINKKNECAWNYRQWLLLQLGGWEDEIKFCDGLLSEDVTLEFAWNQKLFVLENVDKKTRDSIRMKEVKNALLAILKGPNNRYPWMYLRGLYQQTECDDAIIDSVLMMMLSSVVGEVGDPPQVQKELIVNVLDTMLDVMCQKYTLTHRISALIRDLCSQLCPDVNDDVCSEADRLWIDIISVLRCIDPVNKPCWECRVESVREALWEMANVECSVEAQFTDGSEESG
ncbi:hypothetical protein OROHE_020512 [Orobanche hederae]